MTDANVDYTPHPGSSRDAVAVAALHETPAHHAAPAADHSYPVVVETRSNMPEETIPRTMVLSTANPYLPILPRDMQRRRAVILSVQNDVILTESKELAQVAWTQIQGGATGNVLGIGFYLPKATPLPLESRDAMYAVVASGTAATTTTVSVVVERYANPTAY